MKVRCIGYETNENYFTLGKVYETNKDGYLVNDDNFVYDCDEFYIGDWLCDYYKFELVEETEMRIYKVGDKVRIKADLNDGDHGANCGVTREMEQLRGKVATIVDHCVDVYLLDIDNEYWNWSSKMFDLVEETNFSKKDLKSGDVILKRNGNTEIVILETGTFVTKNGFNVISAVNEDLTSSDGMEYDIVAVRRPNEPFDCQFQAFDFASGELVYEREVEELTIEEICKELGRTVKIKK